MDANAVKKSYQRACLVVHPDRVGDAPHADLAHEIFIQLSLAYKVFEDSGAKSLL